MKRGAALITIVLASLILIYAQDNQPVDMTGWICNSTCVKQTAGKAVCDAACTDTSGDAVLVDDDGKVIKISNPDLVKGKMGQRVKMKCRMNKETGSMEILSIYG